MAEPGRYLYEYPRPAVTTDAVVLVLGDAGLDVLLIERGHEPFAGRLALPGGFVDPDEPLETAARRELTEETHVEAGAMLQVGAFGEPGRDPRGHTIGVGFVTLMRRSVVEAAMRAGDDAAAVCLRDAHAPSPLAFDHGDILDAALALVRHDARGRALVLDLLPESFTLDALHVAARALVGDGIGRAALEQRAQAARCLERGADGRYRRVGADEGVVDLLG